MHFAIVAMASFWPMILLRSSDSIDSSTVRSLASNMVDTGMPVVCATTSARSWPDTVLQNTCTVLPWVAMVGSVSYISATTFRLASMLFVISTWRVTRCCEMAEVLFRRCSSCSL